MWRENTTLPCQAIIRCGPYLYPPLATEDFFYEQPLVHLFLISQYHKLRNIWRPIPTVLLYKLRREWRVFLENIQETICLTHVVIFFFWSMKHGQGDTLTYPILSIRKWALFRRQAFLNPLRVKYSKENVLPAMSTQLFNTGVYILNKLQRHHWGNSIIFLSEYWSVSDHVINSWGRARLCSSNHIWRYIDTGYIISEPIKLMTKAASSAPIIEYLCLSRITKVSLEKIDENRPSNQNIISSSTVYLTRACVKKFAEFVPLFYWHGKLLEGQIRLGSIFRDVLSVAYHFSYLSCRNINIVVNPCERNTKFLADISHPIISTKEHIKTSGDFLKLAQPEFIAF